MEKKVKKLIVDFYVDYPEKGELSCHAFPSFTLCNSLTYLYLGCVIVTGEILESFLCNCRTLKSLSVNLSDSLESLIVCGPSLNLKYLIIHRCDGIKQLEISVLKLMLFHYCGPEINVHVKSAPKLAKLVFGGYCTRDLVNICSDISSCLSQIKCLRLYAFRPIKHCNLSIEGSVFTRLKKLEVVSRPYWNEDLYGFMSLIKACPLLHHFKLMIRTNLLDFSKTRELRKRKICRLKHLKIVDLEFAAYIMKSAVFLHKFIVDTRALPSPELEFTEERKQAMQQAELLRADCKPRTTLEIR